MEASKNLNGSAKLLLAIWTFLDKWGIVNFTASEPAEAELENTQAGDAGAQKLQRWKCSVNLVRQTDVETFLKLPSHIYICSHSCTPA